MPRLQTLHLHDLPTLHSLQPLAQLQQITITTNQCEGPLDAECLTALQSLRRIFVNAGDDVGAINPGRLTQLTHLGMDQHAELPLSYAPTGLHTLNVFGP